MHVYMRCIWNVTSLSAKHRVILPRDATLTDAQKRLELEMGGPIRQKTAKDEDGYNFSQLDMHQPLWKFSNQCRLSIDFKDPLPAKDGKTMVGNVASLSEFARPGYWKNNFWNEIKGYYRFLKDL